MLLSLTTFLVAAVLIMVLWLMHKYHRESVRRERHGVFDHCLEFIESYNISQDDIDFPTLVGSYRGYRICLQAVADHVGFRKMPQLWLLLTVYEENPWRGIIDFIVRPQNIEFFSPWEQLPVILKPPVHWPQFSALRSDDTAGMPPLSLIESYIDLFEDVKMKELLITPKGVRFVYQANQARRTEYLVLRSLRFDEPCISGETIRRLLDRAIKLSCDLNKQSAAISGGDAHAGLQAHG